MTAKHSLIIVAVFAVGVTVGLTMRDASSPASAAAQAASATKLPRPEVAKRPRPAELESASPTASAASETPATKPASSEAIPLSTPADASPQQQEMMAAMTRRMEESRTRKIDERVATLKGRLNLTPEQEAKVRALLDKPAEKPSVSGDASPLFVASNGEGGQVAGRVDMATLLENVAKIEEDSQIAGLLEPEQTEQFEAFQQEERRNRMEAAFNREFAQLQEQLTLTPEQKNRAYEALGGVMDQEAAQPDRPLTPKVFDATKQARVDALRPILTPEQLAVYETNPPTPPFGMNSSGFRDVITSPGGKSAKP